MQAKIYNLKMVKIMLLIRYNCKYYVKLSKFITIISKISAFCKTNFNNI